jgi:hypothetical protein
MDTEGQGEEESKETDAQVAMHMDDRWADFPIDLIVFVVARLPCCRAERQPVRHLNMASSYSV